MERDSAGDGQPLLGEHSFRHTLPNTAERRDEVNAARLAARREGVLRWPCASLSDDTLALPRPTAAQRLGGSETRVTAARVAWQAVLEPERCSHEEVGLARGCSGAAQTCLRERSSAG
jgi:hypothetical protein